ncbi:VOC family protein [Gordonia sinesedis]
MTTTPRHHTIDYIEINTDDLPASVAFYERAFGWTFNDYGGQYAGIRNPNGEGEVGGLNPGQPGGPGGPLVQLYSDDLAASEEAVIAAGGQIVVPAFGFPGGRRFHFRDPAGNVLGVWTAVED